ncbi:hypothetical protein ACOMHN_039112 [Nucella lapillus]
MSFEGVFEKWLKSQGQEGAGDKTGGAAQHQQTLDPDVETQSGDRESHTHQDTCAKNSKRMPVSFCSKQTGGKRNSPSPPPVQISVGDDEVGKKRRCNKVKPPYRKDGIHASHGDSKKTVASMIDSKGRKLRNMPVEGQDHQQCHTCSPLTDLTDITPTTTSPSSSADLSRLGHPILSPEHDVPMEPDSTSECLTSNKSLSKSRRKSEVSMQKVCQGREGSPCKAGGAGETSAGVQPGAVPVPVEESQAECDSTCMFLASPNAISPASQGEIEERVCPFLTDHEDGASPAHCVCQCRSLPPPTNLLPRDHLPSITTSASPPSLASPHFTVRIISTKSDSSRSDVNLKATLVSSESHYESKITSDLENFVTKLELKRKKKDEKQEKESVVVAKKEFGKQYLSECADTEGAINACASEVKTYPAASQTQVDLSEVSVNKTEAFRQEQTKSGELSGSVKCAPQQNEVCDFAKHIDWDTAVAETFESSTSIRGFDGESKPGIILKIRAKAVVPCLERNLELKSVKTVSSGKRKAESKGSPEILSRLRKRQKSEPSKPEQANCEQLSSGNYKSKYVKSDAGSNCSCHNSSTTKKRRNTVHVDGDLKSYTRHLSPADCKFVETSARLSRLQTLTYNLVCSLFPLLRQRLNHITPESQHFSNVLDDIIGTLERSDSEEVSKDCQHLGDQFERLRVTDSEVVPVYSPCVVLCSQPWHALEEFQHKVCGLLQLLLPDLTVSLSDCCLRFPGQLEQMVERVLSANTARDRSVRKCRLVSS